MQSIHDAGELGGLVKQHRIRALLSQETVAQQVGVSRSTIIDLEQGRNVSIATALKVLSQLGAGLSVTGAPPSPPLRWTADRTAREIKRELRNGDPDFAMRVLAMATDYFDDLRPADRRKFLEVPASTGRKRWDALLARTLAYKCHQHGLKAPGWTRVQPLSSKWYATPRSHVSQAWKQRMAANTPKEFADANIIFDARNLTSV
ncbi:helix-turn-helix transcriptional regulator [Pseudarthrobacter albicanus]|uniref:helix-turn-helix transcriptional regulator n=1 Tax=Pseudarthrobacter albicanus TaxID=2823873 RepID=UPI001BAB785B|nr:helix-turn-helix domain-containing protein [Pseudarthrobacter albicanus]